LEWERSDEWDEANFGLSEEDGWESQEKKGERWVWLGAGAWRTGVRWVVWDDAGTLMGGAGVKADEDGRYDGEGSYMGGGTKCTVFFTLATGSAHESIAICKSSPYLSWKLLLWLIWIATVRRSAAIPLIFFSEGSKMGSMSQMMRARSR
jgi:hypothetical protein